MSHWYGNRKRTCSAPNCRCESPCDAYYEEEEEERDEWQCCPHCFAGKVWLADDPVHEKTCSVCERGALVETLAETRIHRARKEHAGGLIQPGDTYRREVYGGYEVGGPRWLKTQISLIKKASELEKLAATKYAEKADTGGE